MLRAYNHARPGFYPVFGTLSLQSSRRLRSAVALKTNECFHKNEYFHKADITDNKNLAKKAKKLIFGEKKYEDFTTEEKRIVDLYQDMLLEVDGGVILPNTGADLEQKEIAQLIAELDHNDR